MAIRAMFPWRKVVSNILPELDFAREGIAWEFWDLGKRVFVRDEGHLRDEVLAMGRFS